MGAAAKVISIDAVGRMGTALRAFRAEAGSGLDDLQLEIQRGLQWIHHDRKEYWSAEVRRGEERVTQCRLQLQQAMTYRRVADHQPTCIDEKRALAAAKRRLQIGPREAGSGAPLVAGHRPGRRRVPRRPGAAGRLPRRRSSQVAGGAGPHERVAARLRGYGDSGRSGGAAVGPRARGGAASRFRRKGDSPIFADTKIGTVPPAATREPSP